ncbi:Aste57867_18025 [Aphanomyces stellatus]|uniref:Aste57867_18025 protein n=1 Tax=Aphanomyces stellatus TaxID=120398 RepID=A0A485L988_9STRA|nr:hypothetical protein As57867_017963 [Aphanomyces stellatus]VFT94764.1 Aste57867_18025 [Aphanomyces stellatus]
MVCCGILTMVDGAQKFSSKTFRSFETTLNELVKGLANISILTNLHASQAIMYTHIQATHFAILAVMIKAPSSAPTLPRLTETPALSLSAVMFVSQPNTDAFRVRLFTTEEGDVPMKLWLENKRTKGQWECTVEDIKYHAPKDANYVLPSAVVVSSLKAALLAKDGEGKTPCNDCDVDLEGSSTDAMAVVLTMKAFGGLTASYSFGLTPLAVATTDVLEAKIRDLEEQMAAVTTVQLTARVTKMESNLSTRITAMNSSIETLREELNSFRNRRY